MDDKQFGDTFTAAGGWFLLTQYDEIANWKGEKDELVTRLYNKGFDAKKQEPIHGFHLFYGSSENTGEKKLWERCVILRA